VFDFFIACSDRVMSDGPDFGDDKNSNGESGAARKKRRSVNEKFLEDNSEYYGFQVLSSKLRSSGETAGHSPPSSVNSFHKVLDLLHDREEKVGAGFGRRRRRSRGRRSTAAASSASTPPFKKRVKVPVLSHLLLPRPDRSMLAYLLFTNRAFFGVGSCFPPSVPSM
jgi:hypothetical protein